MDAMFKQIFNMVSLLDNIICLFLSSSRVPVAQPNFLLPITKYENIGRKTTWGFAKITFRDRLLQPVAHKTQAIDMMSCGKFIAPKVMAYVGMYKWSTFSGITIPVTLLT